MDSIGRDSLCNLVKLVSLLLVSAMTAASAGCLHYSAFRVDTGGQELTLKRAESGRSGAEGSEPDRVTGPAAERTVQSLEGARVRLRAEYAGVVDGDVTGTAGPMIAVRCRSSDSAIDDTGESVHSVRKLPRQVDSINVEFSASLLSL